jgi:uncharacterized SAM-binding protein YcdF (DUF218 family)
MRQLFLWAIIVGVIAFIWGFWNFANAVSQPAQDPPRAEAIVALTGGSMQRLETGVRLLKQHKGDRLLISGVNRVVTDQELFSALHIDPATAQCCVDLGRSAEDTLGNASETAAWAREHHYRRIILVTDDYHMPRADAELSLAMPEAQIYRYPVRTRWTNARLWRSDLMAASRVGAEYVKFLVIRSREALIDMTSGAHSADHQKQ